MRAVAHRDDKVHVFGIVAIGFAHFDVHDIGLSSGQHRGDFGHDAAPVDDAPEGGDDDDTRGESEGTLTTIVAAAIPETAVARAMEKLPAALPVLVEPGTAMATRVPPGPEHDRQIGALARIFDRTKWIYDATSPAVIEAGQTGEGTVTYKDPQGRERQLKQVTPTTLRVRVSVHGVLLLEAKLATDIPDNLALAAGETDTGLAARLPPPPADWLDRLLLPARLVDITEADGLGTSFCGASGLLSKPAR